MNDINTGIGISGRDDTSSTEPQEGDLDIPQRMIDLESRADDVESDFHKLEKETTKLKDFSYFIIGAMAVVFVFTSALIGFDYFRNNQDRYEKFMEKTEEIKQSFYTKDQVDKNIVSSIEEIRNQLDNFQKCLRDGGWNRCF